MKKGDGRMSVSSEDYLARHALNQYEPPGAERHAGWCERGHKVAPYSILYAKSQTECCLALSCLRELSLPYLFCRCCIAESYRCSAPSVAMTICSLKPIQKNSQNSSEFILHFLEILICCPTTGANAGGWKTTSRRTSTSSTTDGGTEQFPRCG